MQIPYSYVIEKGEFRLTDFLVALFLSYIQPYSFHMYW